MRYTVRFWADARGRRPVEEWLAELAKPQLRSIGRLTTLLEQKCHTLPPPYAKNLGEGLWELRDTTTGPGMRVYYCFRDTQAIVLLASGQKSTQERDIARARRILDDIK